MSVREMKGNFIVKFELHSIFSYLCVSGLVSSCMHANTYEASNASILFLVVVSCLLAVRVTRENSK